MTHSRSGGRTLLFALFLSAGPALMCCDHPDYVVKQVLDAKLPLIRRMTPTILVPNQVLEIEGTGFGGREGEIYVTDEAQKSIGPLPIESWSDEAIRARIPASLPFDLEGVIKMRTADGRPLPLQPTLRIVGPSGPR